MLPLLGLVYLTFRQLWATKVVLGLFIISSLILFLVSFALNLDVVDGTLAGLRLFGEEPGGPLGSVGLAELVFVVESAVAGLAYWIGILLALFATAPLAVSLLTPGHIDVLLSKPISRTTLLSGHVLGIWLAMAVLAVYLLGGTWLIMSFKSGIWNPAFLGSIGLVVGMFAVMYGAVLLMSVWTESTALALIVSYGLIFASIVLAAADAILDQMGVIGSAGFLTLYHLLPNFAEVTVIVSALSQAEPVGDWYPLWSALLFGAVAYGLALWWFNRRDF